MAAALLTLKGQTLEAKLPSEAEVRVSMLGWTEADKADALVQQYQQYLADKDAKKFNDFLQTQDTRGYLFTKEATGYTVKYAWKSDDAITARMVLLVTPGANVSDPFGGDERFQPAALWWVTTVASWSSSLRTSSPVVRSAMPAALASSVSMCISVTKPGFTRTRVWLKSTARSSLPTLMSTKSPSRTCSMSASAGLICR